MTGHVNCCTLRVVHKWTEKLYKVPSVQFLRNGRCGYTILALCACGLTTQGWGLHCHQSMSRECEGCVSTGLHSRPGQHIQDFCFFIECGKQPCFSKETQRKPQFEGWPGPRLKTGKALLLPQQKGTRGWEGGISDRQNAGCNLEGHGEARSGLSY